MCPIVCGRTIRSLRPNSVDRNLGVVADVIHDIHPVLGVGVDFNAYQGVLWMLNNKSLLMGQARCHATLCIACLERP